MILSDERIWHDRWWGKLELPGNLTPSAICSTKSNGDPVTMTTGSTCLSLPCLLNTPPLGIMGLLEPQPTESSSFSGSSMALFLHWWSVSEAIVLSRDLSFMVETERVLYPSHSCALWLHAPWHVSCKGHGSWWEWCCIKWPVSPLSSLQQSMNFYFGEYTYIPLLCQSLP